MDRAFARKRRLQFLPPCEAIPSNVGDKSAHAIGDARTQSGRAVNESRLEHSMFVQVALRTVAFLATKCDRA